MTTTTTVERKALVAAATLAMGCTGKALEVLACVRLRLLPAGTLEVEATDLAARLTLAVPGQADGLSEWGCCVSPRALIAALRLPGAAERVSLGYDREVCTAVLEVGLGDGMLARLPALAAELWPAGTRMQATAEMVLPPGMLMAALQGVACAASEDETRGKLASVHLRATQMDGKATVTLTATDGRRMHQAWLTSDDTLPWADAEDGEALLRSEDAARLAAFLSAAAAAGGEDGEVATVCVEIGETEVALGARFGGLGQYLVLRQREADGGYPDVRQVLPDQAWPVLLATVDGPMASAVVAGLRKLEATDGRSPAMARLRVDAVAGVIRLDTHIVAADQAYGEAVVACKVDVPVPAPEGLGAETLPTATLDARFLAEALAGAAAAGVPAVIGLRGPGRPATVERPGALCVVMPMTV